MSTRRIIGVVTAVIGALISVGHLVLMVFTDLVRKYHGYETWIGIGFILSVAGIIVIGSDRKEP